MVNENTIQTRFEGAYHALVNSIFSKANGGIERAVLDAYCWMYSSWNIPQEYKGACTGGDQVSCQTLLAKYSNICQQKSLVMRKKINLNFRCTTAYVPTDFTTKFLIMILRVVVYRVNKTLYCLPQT